MDKITPILTRIAHGLHPRTILDALRGAPRPRLIRAAVGLFVVLFLAVNLLADRTLDRARLDVTETGVWSLSEGARALLTGLDEPLHLRLFLSDGLTEAAPQLAAYADRVRGTLETYADLAGGRITLEVVDPAPFSDAEDRALGLGVNRIALPGTEDALFFGLAATNATDGRATIPVFSPDREPWLEYDLTRLVAELGRPEKPKVALIDGIGLSGDPMTGQPEQQTLAMLREFYAVETLSGDIDAFPEGTRVVAVVHPQGLSERTLYALDQWAMGGGATMLFLDPHAETQQGARPGMPPADPASDLAALLEGWGVAFDPTQAVADPAHAIRTTRTVGGRRQEVANPAWLALGPEAMDRETPALARLSSLVMTTAGAFSAAEDGPALTPLLTASAEAALADAATAADGFADPRTLLTDATAPETPPALAARITGALRSAFPDGAPEGADRDAEHRAEAAQANILLVGDADMLMDRNWIQRRSILGASVPQAFANNGDFLLNAAEQMAGGAALADLRGRAVAWRPLERIDDLRREAEAEYREAEQALLARIREAEDKLRDLAPPEGEDGALFAEEAVAEADALRADLLAARAELRRVRYELRRDVDALKGWVTTAHVGAVPALAAIAALAVALRRPRRPLPKRAA